MRHASVLLFAGILLTALLIGVLALVEVRRDRRLRQRVLAIAGGREAGPVASAPSLRVQEVERGPLQRRLLRLVSFDPDLVEARVVPWPLVAVLAAAACAFSTWRLAGLLGTPLALLAGMLGAVLLARTTFRWERDRYRDAVFAQLPDALGAMVRAIRAGLPLAEALRGMAAESASPIREEFTRVVGDMAIGRPVDAALMRVHARTGLTEFSFLAVTLGLQAQTGGSLSETLDTLADMVRKRVSMAKRATALAAEGRLQAGMLFILPFLAAGGMSFIQPFYLRTFIDNPAGQQIAMIGFGLMLLGLLTIRQLIRAASRD